MNRKSTAGMLMQNFVFCTAIALLLWQFVPSVGQHGFWSAFVHSQAIGTSICLLAMTSSYGLGLYGTSNKVARVAALAASTVAGIFIGLVLSAWMLDIPNEAFAYLRDRNTLLVSGVTAIFASLAFNWHMANRQRVLKLELAASEQGRRADQARHAMLQAQLEPHMLFNTLANLRALISTDTEAALDMLDRLDDFLRETLRSSRTRTHTLSHEFNVLENYLALLKVRFGDRLHYELALAPECRHRTIPSLLLQPLVENAVKHAIEPALDGGKITVSAVCTGKATVLKVCDTGDGISTNRSDTDRSSIQQRELPEPSVQQPGFGLDNFRQRLQQTYADSASLSISSRNGADGQGTTITVTLPVNATGNEA